MTILNYLMTSPQSALLVGFSAATALATGVISLRSFLRLRHISLLYLGVLVFLLQLFPGFFNSNPQDLFDMQADPLKIRLAHCLYLLIIFLFYKFVTAVFTVQKYSKWLFYAALFTRLLSILSPTEFFVKVASVGSLLFFSGMAICILIVPSTQKWASLFKIGGCIGLLGINFYPLMRLGFLSLENPEQNIAYILVITFTIFSFFAYSPFWSLDANI